MVSSFDYLDSETTTILKEMKTLFSALPTLVGAEGEFKEAYINQLLDYRTVLETKYRTLSAYKRELQHLCSYRNLVNAAQTETLDAFGISLEDAETLDFEQIANDITNFIFTAPNKKERQVRASAILPHVPIRMTKDSFLDYLEKSLFTISIEDSEPKALLLTSVLKQLLDGKLCPSYGQDFKDIGISIDDLKAYDDLEVFFEEADLLNETLDFAIEVLSHLYRMICSFSNLLIFDGLDFESLTDMHVSFSDLYYTLQGILKQSDDTDVLLETLPERVSTIKESLEKAYHKACKQKDLDPLFMLIQTYLMMDISFVFGFDTGKHDAYSNDVTTVFKDFLAEVKEHLLSLSNEERKLRMQYLMSVLPFIMNQATFSNYISHGFSSSSSLKRNLLTSIYLTNILEEGGYFDVADAPEHHYVEDDYFDEEFGHNHSHNHSHNQSHDHHCGCGHNHSHDHSHGHDCECDHDHN